MTFAPYGAGKSAPLVLQQLIHYLPGSGSIALPLPQIPVLQQGQSVKIVPFSKSEKPNTNSDFGDLTVVHLPMASHVHQFISDMMHSDHADDHDKDTTSHRTNTTHEIRLMCKICRYHLLMNLDITHVGDCGKYPNKLHHFVPQSLSSDLDDGLSAPETFVLTCCICSSMLKIVFLKPWITKEIADTFEPAEIKRRTDAFNEIQKLHLDDGSSEPKLKPISDPANSYSTLAKILRDPCECGPDQEPRSLRISNPILNSKIDGQILQSFFFTKDDTKDLWKPPRVNQDTPESKYRKQVLEQVRMEIAVIVDREVGGNPFQISLENELSTLKSRLSCKHYSTTRVPTYIDPASELSLRCANLGAVPDFSDNLIEATFEFQNSCDPTNASYYLECLQFISTARDSEELQIQVSQLRSLGATTRADLQKAYEELSIVDPSQFDDSMILGIYKARVQDSSPNAVSKLRTALQTIANDRNSELLKSTLAVDNLNEESSYSLLGAKPSTTDEMIISSYEINRSEFPDKRDLLDHAFLVLSKTRTSLKMLSYADSHDLTGPVPNIDEAYNVLGAQKDMEDEHILAVYSIRVEDSPEEILTMRNALKAIVLTRKSALLKNFLDTGDKDYSISAEVSESEPVGLHNIGNTCYLNSLLQFYFTVKPLREMILSFETEAGAELLSDSLASDKRIGGRKVTQWEINRALDFVKELATLFDSMINSPVAAVEPRHQLAYLALVSSEEALEDMRRASTVEIASGSLEQSLEGPMTLEESQSASVQFQNEEEKENVVQSKKIGPHAEPEVPALDRVALSDITSDNLMNETFSISKETNDIPDCEGVQSDEKQADVSGTEDHSQEHENAIPSLPSRSAALTRSSTIPPQLPPRNDSDMMFGSQQDVTECIDNVLFQLESALKPESVDDDGEQIDLIKDLFYGKTKQTLIATSTTGGKDSIRTKEERFSHLIVDVADGARDLYEALDAYFSVETVNLDDRPARRFVTLQQLPPVLQVQVQRVQFDRKQGRAYKSNAPLIFDQMVYMDRYMDQLNVSGIDIQQRREQLWQWQEEKKRLVNERDKLVNGEIGNSANNLSITRDWLKQVEGIVEDMTRNLRSEEEKEIDAETLLNTEMKDESQTGKDIRSAAVLSEVVCGLNQEIERIHERVRCIDEELERLTQQMRTHFDDLQNLGYRIHSVFIHRGQATFGHYWIYIYDFERKKFRKYNDEKVTDVTDQEVMPFAGQTSEGVNSAGYDETAGTPYFLVFVRNDLLDTLVQAVDRHLYSENDSLEKGDAKSVDPKNCDGTIIDLPQVEVVDTIMTDVES
ncbi:uncharacterized protein V1516DRAFT_670846 [Lipomyces oligophaga]|uniref:uncharacterized protein n=1 Tax=Lipomyces oligophaga TaxID=45792 RepID=UPI0034D00C1A